MPEITIYCKNICREITINGGESLSGILDMIRDQIPFNPICALVNNKAESLDFPIYHPKEIEFISHENTLGHYTYIRSLCMMLYRATAELCPERRLAIVHSISNGYYCRFLDNGMVTETLVAGLEAKMKEYVEQDIPFIPHEERRTDVIAKFRSQGLEEKALLLETLHDIYFKYYTLDNLADSFYAPLAPSTSHLRTFALAKYHEGFLLLGPSSENPMVTQKPVIQEKMHQAFNEHLQFNRIIGVSTVGQLNKSVNRRRAADLINVAEALHAKKISQIADLITQHYRDGGARIILIAGPSSSGKTTTAKRLAIFLQTNLLKPKTISLDNYFVDRRDTPRDSDGDYDYESLHALDLELFNRNLTDLIAGKEVALPTYNFETGTRQFRNGNKMKLDANSILLIEGIHGLNPELTAQIPEKMKFRVYVSALTTLAIDYHNWISTSDNRLLRRIIRDYKYRGTSAIETIRRWPSVRRGEEKWIFPYQENADATFNSTLIFELAVMKDYALEILRNVPNDRPEYTQAHRLRTFLNLINPIPAAQLPPTSLLREFLGGSSLRY